jgi:hypothetical protein
MAEIKDEIKKIKLRGFENYDLSKILYMTSEIDKIVPQETSSMKLFYLLIIRCFFQNWHFKYMEAPRSSILFLYDASDGRKDTLEMFNHIVSLSESRDILITSKSSFFKKIHIATGVKILLHLYLWYGELRKTRLNGYQKINILMKLELILKRNIQSSFVNISKYKLLVVFFDASPLYNFFVQKFKRASVKTATFQHGVILAKREGINNVDIAGIELGNCISDYLLAWNRFTYKEAVKSGIDKERIKIVGISRCINLPVNCCNATSRHGIFGVVLDGIHTEKNNSSLILLANKLAEEMNYKYILRYHPSFKGDEYNHIIDMNRFLHTGKNDTSIFEYAKMVDFSLIANSTVLFELVYMKHKVYRYSSNDMMDKYRDIPYNSFSSFDELLYLLNKEEDCSQALYDLCCSVNDIRKAHRDFFLMFD